MSENIVKAVRLPDLPKDKYYEDYVAAQLSMDGCYVERSIEQREPTQVLELDIVASIFTPNEVKKTICEVKSGGWGISDIFKVKGWLDYLGYNQGLFVSLNSPKQDHDKIREIAESINVKLVDIKIDDKQKDVSQLVAAYNLKEPNKELKDCMVPILRFAYALEQMFFEYSNTLAKTSDKKSFKDIKDFIYVVNQHSFFTRDSTDRLTEIFNAYKQYTNLSARTDNEITTGSYVLDSDGIILSDKSYKELYYEVPAKKNPLHLALYAEMICRLTVLRLCVEESIYSNPNDDFLRKIERLKFPENFRNAIIKFRDHKYCYLYPYFWQIFIYVFGGLILLDKQQDEYKLLSEITGIPLEEIDNALSAFDIIFPMQNDSWLLDLTKNGNYSHLKLLRFMPVPFYGLGANFRRLIYRQDDNNVDFDGLKAQVKGKYTVDDLIKYNNILIEYLSNDKTLEVKS